MTANIPIFAGLTGLQPPKNAFENHSKPTLGGVFGVNAPASALKLSQGFFGSQLPTLTLGGGPNRNGGGMALETKQQGTSLAHQANKQWEIDLEASLKNSNTPMFSPSIGKQQTTSNSLQSQKIFTGWNGTQNSQAFRPIKSKNESCKDNLIKCITAAEHYNGFSKEQVRISHLQFRGLPSRQSPTFNLSGFCNNNIAPTIKLQQQQKQQSLFGNKPSFFNNSITFGQSNRPNAQLQHQQHPPNYSNKLPSFFGQQATEMTENNQKKTQFASLFVNGNFGQSIRQNGDLPSMMPPTTSSIQPYQHSQGFNDHPIQQIHNQQVNPSYQITATTNTDPQQNIYDQYQINQQYAHPQYEPTNQIASISQSPYSPIDQSSFFQNYPDHPFDSISNINTLMSQIQPQSFQNQINLNQFPMFNEYLASYKQPQYDHNERDYQYQKRKSRQLFQQRLRQSIHIVLDVPPEPVEKKKRGKYMTEREKKQQQVNASLPIIGNFIIYPTLSQLSTYPLENLKKVRRFRIENEFGCIEFLQPVSVFKVDLSKGIRIMQDCIEINQPELDRKQVLMTFVNFGNYVNKNKEEQKEIVERVKKSVCRLEIKEFNLDIENGNLYVLTNKRK